MTTAFIPHHSYTDKRRLFLNGSELTWGLRREERKYLEAQRTGSAHRASPSPSHGILWAVPFTYTEKTEFSTQA